MNLRASRRNFLAAGLGMPAAAVARPQGPQAATGAKPGALEYRTIGKTGLKVTSVGMGCMITSDPTVISRAVDMGINYFDTARDYSRGNNERMVGGALKGKRNKVILSSKSHAMTAEKARADLDTSLKELGTDYLDIWFIHNRDEPSEVPDELIPVWEDAKKQGKARFIGISTHNPNAMLERILQIGKLDVVLSVYNFAVGSANDAAFARLAQEGIGLVAMKVMAPASREFGFTVTGPDRTKQPGGPLAALKWVLRNKGIGTTIPSMTDTDQLEEDFRAMSEPFGAQDEKVLAAVNENIRPLYCRMCHSCSGQCPQGMQVANVIRHLSYSDFYGQYGLGREHFQALPEKVRMIHCADCNECVVKCPNGVHVQERLVRAQQLFA